MAPKESTNNSAKQERPKAEEKTKGPVTKEKLRTIMEVASALTSMNEESGSGSESPASSPPASPTPSKRYIPEHKRPDAALTFPEKLMAMMQFADKAEDKEKFCVAWHDDGKAFIVREADEFTRTVIPSFFKATKFSSFTRKLYRWGFRQVNRGIGPDDPIIFGNENFQRDNAELMVKMRSTTAAGTRKAQQRCKRSLDENTMGNAQSEEARKRVIMGWKEGGMSQQGSIPVLNLATALRPSLGMNMNMNPLLIQQQAAQAEHHKRMAFLHQLHMQQQTPAPQPQHQQLPPQFQQLQQHQHQHQLLQQQGLQHLQQNAHSLNPLYNMPQGGAAQPPQSSMPPQSMNFPPQQAGTVGFNGSNSTAEIINSAIKALQVANNTGVNS